MDLLEMTQPGIWPWGCLTLIPIMSMLSLRETWRSMKATQPGPGGARKGTQDSQMPMSHFLKDGGY